MTGMFQALSIPYGLGAEPASVKGNRESARSFRDHRLG